MLGTLAAGVGIEPTYLAFQARANPSQHYPAVLCDEHTRWTCRQRVAPLVNRQDVKVRVIWLLEFYLYYHRSSAFVKRPLEVLNERQQQFTFSASQFFASGLDCFRRRFPVDRRDVFRKVGAFHVFECQFHVNGAVS